MNPQSKSANRETILTLARVALAIIFAFFGALKFLPHSMYVRIFAQIGFGEWFRYFTGVVEIGSAGLLLIRGMVLVGALLLCCTMAGAVSFWLLYRNVIAAVVPGVLLIATAYVGLVSMNKA